MILDEVERGNRILNAGVTLRACGLDFTSKVKFRAEKVTVLAHTPAYTRQLTESAALA